MDANLSVSQLRKQKRRLFREKLLLEQNGKCAVCDRDIKIYVIRNHQKVPSDSAHLQHLETRLDKDRGMFGHHTRRHIVVCNSCCYDYGRALQDNLAPEEIWARSGRAPQENPFEEFVWLHGDA